MKEEPNPIKLIKPIHHTEVSSKSYEKAKDDIETKIETLTMQIHRIDAALKQNKQTVNLDDEVDKIMERSSE